MRALAMAMGIALAILAAGCAGTKLGDGRIGSISYEPAVDALATWADKQAPGTGAGDKLRAYYATSLEERVPFGWRVEWRAYYDGQEIQLARIVRVPHLAPSNGQAVNVPPPAIVTNTPSSSDEIMRLLESIGGAGK